MVIASGSSDQGDMRRFRHLASGKVHKGKAACPGKLHCNTAEIGDCELLTIATSLDADEGLPKCGLCFRKQKC